MKYESSILKRLVDTYGVVGNPRYISEIIKEFIVRGKERFPDLFTYQSDWLAHIDEFGLNPTYTVSYTGQSIYAPNTLERPVKSAILKGQTLVNLVVNSSVEKTVGKSSRTEAKYDYIYQLENNKEYTLQFEISNFNATQPMSCSFDDGWSGMDNITIDKNGVYKTKFTTTNRKSTQVWFFWTITNWEDGNSATVKNIIILEGDYTNEDIPYFEGMQSVKMPVLTTVGKNLYSSEVEIGGINNSTGVLSVNTNTVRSKNPISVKENTTYTISNDKEYNNYIYFYSADGIFISYLAGKTNPFTFTTPSGASYIRTRTTEAQKQNDLTIKWQLEKSSSTSSYEPFKSNILTVNEPIELRGIGNVQDTLDCLTGDVTQRIGEVVLNGSESWSVLKESNNTITFRIPFTNFPNYDKMLCSVLKTQNPYLNPDDEGIWHNNSNQLQLTLLKTKVSNVDSLKTYLAENNITFHHQLAESVIKTVDLTVKDQNDFEVSQLSSFNGGTHFTTSSQDGSLLPSISVDVVTDLEETLMVCSLEGNTM